MSEIRKTPTIRFKGFTDDWQKNELKELIRKPISDGPHETPTYVEKGIPFLSVEAIHDGVLDLSKFRGYISEKDNELYNRKYKPEINDVLITKAATIGRVALVETDSVFNIWSPIGAIKVNESVLFSRFLFYHLQLEKIQKEAINASNNGSQLNLGMKKIEQFHINYPKKLQEQELLASIFKSIDSLITLIQRKNEKLQQVKKALLEKMFPKDGEVAPEIRFKGFMDAWEKFKLDDLGFFKSNGVDKLSKPNEIPVNLLNYMDVYNRRQVSNKNANELMQVTAKPSQLIENSVIKNDVFFTPTSETPEDIGRVYVIEETLSNTVYSYHLMRFRPNHGIYHPNFPNYSLMTENVRKQFFLAAKGVQRYVISKADFESIVDTIPKYKEQTKIGEFFRSIDSLITLHQRKYEKLQNIKKALLQKMFV